jgi:alpha-L-arabinofuranosidase
MLKTVLMFIFSALSILSFADVCSGDPSISCNVTNVSTKVIIGEPLAEAKARDVSQFFGLHVLFWAFQADLYANTPSKVAPQAVSILKNSGVGFIRYGGGVNEIDWHGCMGWVMERSKQQLVSWSGPMRCIFGLAEYEKLNDELELSSSWHIANVVGFESGLQPINRLAKDAGERALLIKQLSGDRKRYWELGNELDRDTLRWNAEKIIERDIPVAKAILKNDPAAKLIVALLEYSPGWIKNADEHNRTLVRQHKSLVNNYALHLYYDNPPWGPSVANRLASIRNVAKIISSEAIENPAIWITEHARTPPGTPDDKNWNKGWYQTGNHDAVIATADFLVGTSQIPMVKGAAWHGQGLRVGPWTFIDVKKDGSLVDTRTSRLFEMLKPSADYLTLQTKTNSIFDANLPGNYAIRATAFQDKKDSNNASFVVWLVNRSGRDQKVDLLNDRFNKSGVIKIKQTNMADSYQPSQLVESLPRFTQSAKPVNGEVSVNLPKRSVVLLKISVKPL